MTHILARRPGDPELREGDRLHRRRQLVLLHEVDPRALVRHAAARAPSTHLADRHRGRYRLRNRVRLRACRAPLQLACAAHQRLHSLPLHDSVDRALPGARADHGHHGHDDRDRARRLHAARSLPQHARRAAQRAAGRDRGGAWDGADAAAGTSARRAAARAPGDFGRDPDRGRHDDQPCDRSGVHHAVRSRQADLRRAADQLPHRVRRLRPARDRAGARRRRRARGGAAHAHTVAEGTR